MGGAGFAQHGVSTQKFTLPRAATVDVRAVHEDYQPLLVRLEAPAPDGRSEKAWLAQEKAKLQLLRQEPTPSSNKVDSTAPSPWLGANFQSNQVINGVPNDNDMAISNGGKVVSVINSNIYMHDADGTPIGNLSLDAWSAPSGVIGSKFDPRALYDPHHDRFIIVCLSGFTDSTSKVVVGFSQTNDPAGAWNLYVLPGDPNNDSLWTDYPIMALTENELFLTANLLYNDQPWQTGFNQSICWQMDLDSVYAGGALDSRLWFNPQFGGRPVRNLCPIQAGSMPAGPNLYLLSNRNLSAGNDTVFIMEITDTLNAPGVQFLVDYKVSNMQYSLPPDAVQQFNSRLATNDARWLDGFLQNGNIQFVGNCRDTSTGRAGFYHGIVTDVTGARTVTGKVTGFASGDYGYPGIAWMGTNSTDNDALIAINYCGPTTAERAGCGGIYYDGNGNYAPFVLAKAGLAYIEVITGLDRWGDYTGAQAKYDEPGVVWIGATFAKSNRQPGTWIAAFHHPSTVGVSPAPIADGFASVAYPNPTPDMLFVEFVLEADAFLDISIWDAQGRKVKTLVRDLVRAGKQRLSCSTAPLAKGVYQLQVMDGERVLSQHKIVRMD